MMKHVRVYCFLLNVAVFFLPASAAILLACNLGCKEMIKVELVTRVAVCYAWPGARAKLPPIFLRNFLVTYFPLSRRSFSMLWQHFC